MGTSNSVQKMLEKSERDRKRLEEIDADLKANVANMVGELKKDQIEFYEKNRNWKFSSYVSGAHSDFQTTSTWSFDNLSAIIQSIAVAIVGALGPVKNLPEGAEASEDVAEINKSGGITEDVRLLVAANCLNLLSGIVNSFGKSSKVQISSATSSVPIGQGLRIFAAVSCNVSQEKGFFENKIMNSYRYGYLVSYSLDEFIEQAEMALVAQYELTLSVFNLAAKENFDDYVNKRVDLKQYKETADVIEKMTIDIIEKIKALNKKEGAPAKTLAVYKGQSDFLKRCLVNYGFDSEVSERIKAQLVRLSGISV